MRGENSQLNRFITPSYVALIDYQFFRFHSNTNRLDRQYQEYIFVRVFALAKNHLKNLKKNLVFRRIW